MSSSIPKRQTWEEFLAETATRDLRRQVVEAKPDITHAELIKYDVRDIEAIGPYGHPVGKPYYDGEPMVCRVEGNRVQKIRTIAAEENQ